MQEAGKMFQQAARAPEGRSWRKPGKVFSLLLGPPRPSLSPLGFGHSRSASLVSRRSGSLSCSKGKRQPRLGAGGFLSSSLVARTPGTKNPVRLSHVLFRGVLAHDGFTGSRTGLNSLSLCVRTSSRRSRAASGDCAAPDLCSGTHVPTALSAPSTRVLMSRRVR